jgi:hypothetical protein
MLLKSASASGRTADLLCSSRLSSSIICKENEAAIIFNSALLAA